MKLAVCTTTPEVSVPVPLSLLTGSFSERLDRALALGYDGVELMVLDPGQLDADQVTREVRARDLEVAAISSGVQFLAERLTLVAEDPATERRAWQRFEELVDFAAVCGAPLVTVGSFRGRLAAARREQEGAAPTFAPTFGGTIGGTIGQRAVEALRRCADAAADRGVRVALEPLNRYETDFVHTAQEGMALIRQLGHPALGLLLDTFHMNIEEPDIAAALRTAGGRLWHVHLGDSNRLPPGRGHLDFGRVVETLREIDYSGYLSAELLALPDPDSAAQRTMQVMDRLVPSRI